MWGFRRATKKLAEEKRLECLDKFCDGDIEPKVNKLKWEAFKLGGQWFVVPRAYGGYNGSLAFFWPSRLPARGGIAAPEFIPSSSGVNSNFYDVAVEMFIRSNVATSHGLTRYEALLAAESEGRVISKVSPRKGLEVWHVRDNVKGLTPAVWYVATDLKGTDGQPPVLGCDEQDPKFDQCTMAFWWLPGTAVDLRFRGQHGSDWPEIYQEVIRVLQLIKKA